MLLRVLSVQTLIPFERVVISEEGFIVNNHLGILTEGSVVFKRLRDFSEWKSSEVAHGGSLRELEVLIFGLDTIYK